jgi:hypothetical protein
LKNRDKNKCEKEWTKRKGSKNPNRKGGGNKKQKR